MLLIFRLGRPDVLPATDYGVQKGFAVAKHLGELPKPKELLAAGECWAPHRTVAAWYLWRTADTATPYSWLVLLADFLGRCLGGVFLAGLLDSRDQQDCREDNQSSADQA